jgi:hypothetical protein
MATEFDTGENVYFCRFHRDVVAWMYIIEQLGGQVPPKTLPFQLPSLFLERLRKNGQDVSQIRIGTDEHGRHTLYHAGDSSSPAHI